MAATLATAAILPAAPAEAANERPCSSRSAPARVHHRLVEFCSDQPRECDTRPLEARDVVLTQKSWKDLVRINKWVNDTIKPMNRHGALGRG